MKLEIDKDEVWPVYSLVPAREWTKEPLNLPDELYSEFLEIQYKFNKMQKQLEEIYEQACAS